MVPLTDIREPILAHYLIAFTDLRAFVRVARHLGTSAEVFRFLDDLAHLMSRIVDVTSGKILKFIGDSALVVYPGEFADLGARNLLELKSSVDAHIAALGLESRLAVSAHYGEASIGPFGPERRLDIFGDNVNRAATAAAGDRRVDFVITPEAFRRLESDTRKLFKKYTPPIVYVAA